MLLNYYQTQKALTKLNKWTTSYNGIPKNVGIIGIKPDVHLLRICGPERLGIFKSQNLNEVIKSFEELSKETKLSMTYLDNLFWIFGAKDYGEICSSTPKCFECDCELKESCNYPKNHPLED